MQYRALFIGSMIVVCATSAIAAPTVVDDAVSFLIHGHRNIGGQRLYS